MHRPFGRILLPHTDADTNGTCNEHDVFDVKYDPVIIKEFEMQGDHLRNCHNLEVIFSCNCFGQNEQQNFVSTDDDARQETLYSPSKLAALHCSKK